MSDATTNTLLLNILSEMGSIRSDIGGIKQQLLTGAEKHKEFVEQIDMIDRRTDIIEGQVVRINETLMPTDGVNQPIVTRIKNLETFMGRFGAIIATATTILLGSITLISWGVTAFKNDIMSFFRR